MKKISKIKSLLVAVALACSLLSTGCSNDSDDKTTAETQQAQQTGEARSCTVDEVYYINKVYLGSKELWRPTDLPESFQSCFFLEAKKATYERLFQLKKSCTEFINNMPDIYSCGVLDNGLSVDFLVADTKVNCRLIHSKYDQNYEDYWRGKFQSCNLTLND